jgi:hypothetical protein
MQTMSNGGYSAGSGVPWDDIESDSPTRGFASSHRTKEHVNHTSPFGAALAAREALAELAPLPEERAVSMLAPTAGNSDETASQVAYTLTMHASPQSCHQS